MCPQKWPCQTAFETCGKKLLFISLSLLSLLMKPTVLTSGEEMTFSHNIERLMSCNCIQGKRWHLLHAIGCEWTNLTFIIWELKYGKNPIFNVINTILSVVLGSIPSLRALINHCSILAQGACGEAIKVIKKSYLCICKGLYSHTCPQYLCKVKWQFRTISRLGTFKSSALQMLPECGAMYLTADTLLSLEFSSS